MLTNDELDAIELRLLSAQPGPWAVSSEDDDTVFIDVPGGVGALAWFDSRDEADAEFCAHARTECPRVGWGVESRTHPHRDTPRGVGGRHRWR